MSEAGTKTCPQCAETIQAAARVCPCCQSPQGRWSLRWQEFGTLVPVAILIAVWAGLAAWIESRTWWQGGRPFAPHRADLEVMRPVLDGPNRREAFFVTGLVTNHGRLPWRVRTLELRFLNPDGSLLDGMQSPVDEPFVIQPQSEAAFRVTVGKLPPAVSAARVEARVQDAKDGNLPADPP